jgi:hypothetical protein
MSATRPVIAITFASVLFLASAARAPAQGAAKPFLVEGGLGHAGFIDSPIVDHFTVGGSARVFVTPRIAIGPEVVYMRGPGTDRDRAIMGTLSFDLLPDAARSRRVVPYLVVSGGLTRQSVDFASVPFTSTEGALSGGIGARIALGRGIYLAPEARLGWEPLTRVAVSIGLRR